ncbi:MAG: family 16 glycoside hydrolase [Chthoniobacteraceae bacterium]
MNQITRILVTSIALSSASFAEKSTAIAPVLAKPGTATVDDSFSTSELGKQWAVAKGAWEVKGGALVGSEKKEDKHAAVLTLGQKNHDSMIRFSFKLDGTDGLSLSFNHAAGHLFRVNIAKDGVTVMKDGDKRNPAIKSATLGKAEAKFEQGQWYTMLVEVRGAKVSVQTDNGVKLSAADDALNVDKTGYRFVVKGASVALADVKAWELAGGTK